MSIAKGTRFGPYEILAPLGAGGMGEVYRARDTRLERTVALKILAPALARDPDLNTRFEREARAIASLQHPNICVLHDLGREADTAFLVMEFLEGETLADRLRRGPLPLPELVKIGSEIAAGLERAHRAGIVHRDLKPGNIMLTKSGAKLLDFGLAKPRFGSSSLAGNLPTLRETPATQAGALLGTLPYMSPEQLAGAEADPRSDIFALGCVLYETSTGKTAFSGTVAVAPPALDRLIRACRDSDPDLRVQSARDVGLMLQELAQPASAASATAPRAWLWPAVGATALAAALALAWVAVRRAPVALRLSAEISPPPGMQFTFAGSFPGPPVLSPDGSKLMFVAHNASGSNSIWIRALDQSAARQVPNTGNVSLPFWSPDGTSIGYFTQSGVNGAGKLMLLNLAGGLPRAVADSLTPRGGTWSADGTIVFAPNISGGLLRVPAAGGPAATVTRLESSRFSSHRYPFFLPDGRHFLYLAVNHDDASQDTVFWASLDGRDHRPLLHSLTGAIFAAGRLLYSAEGTLLAQSFDPATGKLSGTARPLVNDVFDDNISWRPGYTAANNGLIVYASGSPGVQRAAWVDRSGRTVSSLAPYTGTAISADVSSDGKRLAISLDQGMQDVWVEDVAGSARSRLTFGPVADLMPAWSPDGKWIAYSSEQNGAFRVMRRAADGGIEQQVAPALDGSGDLIPFGWSRDSAELICVLRRSDFTESLLAVPLDGRAPPRTLEAAPGEIFDEASVSPDGRWASFVAGPAGQPHNLFVVPFRGSAGRWQVTTQGVLRSFWTSGGRELDVVDATGALVAIPVASSPGAPSFGAPKILAANFPPALAATPDGLRFLVRYNPDDQVRLRLLTAWNH